MINQQLIFIDIDAHTKEEVFEYIAKVAVNNGIVNQTSIIIEGLHYRESLSTTGMIDGFAIPHAEVADLKESVVIIIKLKEEIDWESLDGEKIKFIVAMLVDKDSKNKEHLTTLSTIAKILMKQENRDLLHKANNQEEIYTIFEKLL
ncbi:PTS system, fructose-specific IIA component/PTS system, fructose-specific IIC component [Granulicatella balaenopterae]|uniref:PTS system, fructose-specific IIA component/PTS system, fructose-specific IIC component n=2 Tax=Granulicatella balaenopterae TaxID=137733 RepID=A0A1H9N4Q7_9LACT|nr:PTS system, fructose-specific IIA component/PTS system, fructose-specific IIC component [Granulicatella balaenopterae]